MSDRRITIRLSDEEFRDVERRAEKSGNTVAGEVRAALQAQSIGDIIAAAITAAENRTAERIHGTTRRITEANERIPEAIERRLYARLAELFTAPTEPRP